MKKEFTHNDLFLRKGCYSLLMVANFCKHRPNIITLYDIMTSDIPLTDKQWFLYHECSIEKHESIICCFANA